MLGQAGAWGGWLGWGILLLAGSGLGFWLYRDNQALKRDLRDGAPGRSPLFLLPAAAELWAETQRRQHAWQREQAALMARLATSRTLLEALPDPLVLLDSGRCVRLANLAARQLFNPKMEERDLAAFLRFPALLAAVDAVLTGGRSQQVELHLPVPVEQIFMVTIHPLPPATTRALLAEAQPQPDLATPYPGNGATTAPTDDLFLKAPAHSGHSPAYAAVLSFHDITAIRRSEQMRGDFIANASHELRTPLSTLIGFIETLRGPARDDSEARERFLAIMHDQASRMARLVKDLLSLSRIELEEHRPPTEPLDAGACIQRIADTFELEARSRNVALVLDIPAILPPVLGDEDQLAQVLMNLLGNALKFTRPGTTVTVQARVGNGAGSGLHITVTDQGEGIARHHLPRLTERFYRVDTARSRSLGGTGLGLAIVKHIVNRHRGRLHIESETGKGSAFTVVLPLASLPQIAPPTR